MRPGGRAPRACGRRVQASHRHQGEHDVDQVHLRRPVADEGFGQREGAVEGRRLVVEHVGVEAVAEHHLVADDGVRHDVALEGLAVGAQPLHAERGGEQAHPNRHASVDPSEPARLAHGRRVRCRRALVMIAVPCPPLPPPRRRVPVRPPTPSWPRWCWSRSCCAYPCWSGAASATTSSSTCTSPGPFRAGRSPTATTSTTTRPPCTSCWRPCSPSIGSRPPARTRWPPCSRGGG